MYEVEPYKQQKQLVQDARDGTVALAAPTLVKPKRCGQQQQL